MTIGSIAIAPLTPEDWAGVRSVYAEGIATGNATLETQTPSWETWDRAHRADCRLVARGSGLGTRLLERLILCSEEAGIWTLQAGIFPENAASVAIHEKCGFRVVGVRERLGKLAGSWRDVVLLERRSGRVGI